MAKKICPYCEGRGCHITQCPNCSGTGKVKCERHRQTFIELFTGCKNCGDTGKVSCYKCAGKGTVNLGSIAVFGEEGICKACGGKGRVPTTVPEPNEAEKCPECHGKGIVKRTYSEFGYGPGGRCAKHEEYICRCPICQATGYVIKKEGTCTSCQGTGKIKSRTPSRPATANQDAYYEDIQCGECRGTGHVISAYLPISSVNPDLDQR
jgi:DnaJ-class molecular chaperone